MSSPDAYRARAGYRRNEGGAGLPALVQRTGPVQAYTTYDLTDPTLAEFMAGGRVSDAGIRVGERRALRNSTFFRAASVICGSVGMLPIHLMRRTDDEVGEKARDHPLFNVLHRKPNEFQTAFEFKSYMQYMALADGQAYALPIRSRGAIRQLIPLPRRSVTPRLTENFDFTFEYRRPSGGTVILGPNDLFHFRAPLSVDGLRGVSLLDVATDTLGIALQAQRAAGKLFSKGMMAGGALETDESLGDEAIKNLRESLREEHAGADNAGDWLILEEGLKAKPFAGSAKDAQLAEVRKHEAEEMSRFTGVPRPLLSFDETTWGSGVDSLGQFFVTYCLLAWFVIWEEAIWRLLSPAEQTTLYAKFNDGALMRGSLKDQGEFFARALGAGGSAPWMKPNEVREKFEMKPADGGDVLPKPGNPAPAPTPEDPPAPKPAPKKKVQEDDE